MKKLLISIFSFIFILLVFFSTYSFFESEAAVKTFKHFSSPHYKLSAQLLSRYQSEDPSTKEIAQQEIISITLKGLGYEKWEDYIDYIQLQVYKGHVLPNSTNQAIIVLNLTKDLAVIGIYDQVGDGFVYHSKIEGLNPVEEIQLKKISTLEHSALIIFQTIDERFGAFFYEEFLDIYYHLSEDFKKVWHKTLYYEEIYKEIWIDPKGDENQWNRVLEETVVDFVSGDPFKINTVTSLKKYSTKSKNPPEVKDFTLVTSSSHQDSYYWSNRYNTFVLGEVTQDVFLSNAALLKDMSRSRESLYGIANQNYKIVTSNGDLIYLPKNNFKGMFQFIFEE